MWKYITPIFQFYMRRIKLCDEEKKTIHMQSFLIKYGHIFWTFPTPFSKQKMMSENPNPYISLFLPLNTGKRQ